ncbi:hypothetical protein B0H16DRAFT_1313182, partial [Mycena metata]
MSSNLAADTRSRDPPLQPLLSLDIRTSQEQWQPDDNRTPIFILPPELTSTIFVECVEPGISPHSAPLLLLQICRTWTAIALSTPMLWSNLELDSTLPSTVRTPQMFHGLTAWLDRSFKAPLNVVLHPHAIISTGPALDFVLQQHACHLERLTVHPRNVYRPILMCAESFPMLRTLDL